MPYRLSRKKAKHHNPHRIMSHKSDPSKHELRKPGLHRSVIAGGLAWLFAGSLIVACIVSPGGDPYSMVLFTAVIFPASIAAYWLGFRHGRAATPANGEQSSPASDRFAP